MLCDKVGHGEDVGLEGGLQIGVGGGLRPLYRALGNATHITASDKVGHNLAKLILKLRMKLQLIMILVVK